ncbi:MAG: PQQ-binding-like beta-propeller repeat protein [Chloroflexales bacterium]|nr:PQQ-binding-like beta-propeller repeat protein [Chloroflexales bacterium]
MTKRTLGALLIIALTFVALTQPASAGPRDQPPPLPGWTHTPRYADDTSARHGIRLSGGPILRGSPVIAEVDGNATNGSEVVVGGSDGQVYAFKADGSLLWQKPVPDAGCSSFSLINGRPSVGNLYGDGAPYVLVGYGTIEDTGRACDGGVVAFRGSDGQQAWNFSLQAFESQTPEPAESLHGVVSSPTLADADGDGKLEVAFGGLDRNAYLLNYNGSVRWYYHAADTVWSSPLFVNVDSDPALELIVATDISANPNVIPPTHDGGFLHAFDTAPRSPAHIDFQTGFLWRTPFDQVLFSSPLAADLLPNNPGLELAIGSGCYFPRDSDDKRGKWVKIVSPASGAVLQTLNAPGCVQSSPAAGDIDDDGQPELVAMSRGSDGKGHIVAWDPTSASPKWDKVPGDPNSGSNDAMIDLQSPVIADLDGNGSLEVLAANFWSVHVLSGKDGSFLTYQGSGSNLPSLFAWGTLKATPAVGDINRDGKLDVVMGGTNVPFDPNRGLLYAWTNFAGVLNSQAGGQAPYSAPWPQLLRSAGGQALLSQPALTASARSISAVAASGASREYRIGIGSADGSSISPSVSEASDPSDIVTASVSGTTVTIAVDTAGKANGTYAAVVNVDSSGLQTLPLNVTVTVVDRASSVALPAAMR